MKRRDFCLAAAGLPLAAQAFGAALEGEEPNPPGAPVVFWMSDPVQPGETLMLFGDGLNRAKVLAFRLEDTAPTLPVPDAVRWKAGQPGRELAVLQTADQCLKLDIPGNWRPGAFAIRLAGRPGETPPLIVNRAEVWWTLGNLGSAVTPGSPMRIFGKNFRLDSGESAWQGAAALQDGKGRWRSLSVSESEKYSLTLAIPADTEPGTIKMAVHNGSGGRWGWSAPVTVEIRNHDPWPTDIFNVRDFGAAGDALRDDTASIRAALSKCNENGGGVVFLPRGSYRISGQLNLPRRTVLRGEKREIVWLFVPKEIPQFSTVLGGQGEFRVEELSIVGQTPWRMITAPDVESMYREYMPWGQPGSATAHDVALRRLRIQHLRYAHRVGTVAQDPRRAEVAGPSTVALAGERLDISDCEIVSSGMPIVIHGTKHTRVERNTLRTGRNGWYGFWGATETVIEGNVIAGQDLEASYGGFANYGNGSGNDISRLYIARNRFLNGFGDEREAITFDTPGRYPWTGRVSQAGPAWLVARGEGWKKDDLAGLACLVVAGKGLGQHRRILSNDAARLTVDAPWDITPDSTSVVSILPFRRDVVVYCNHSQDTSVGVQLYGGGYNFIIDGNQSVRTGGLWGTAAQYERPASTASPHVFLPCYFTQWVENEIREGFVYQQGPEEDDSATLGLYARNIPAGRDAGVLILGNVIRRNRVNDNTRIGLFYYGQKAREEARQSVRDRAAEIGRDAVIEANAVSDSPVGIDVEAGFHGTVIRNNEFVRVAQHVRRRKWDSMT